MSDHDLATYNNIQHGQSDAPDIDNELNELFRWYYSNQTNSIHRSLAAIQGQTMRDPTAVTLMPPPPVRFIRKTNPAALKRGVNSAGTAYSRESFGQSVGSVQQSCETSARPAVDLFGTLLEKLMNFDGAYGSRSDVSEIGSLDAELNEAS
jgi:hypothetical protein